MCKTVELDKKYDDLLCFLDSFAITFYKPILTCTHLYKDKPRTKTVGGSVFLPTKCIKLLQPETNYLRQLADLSSMKGKGFIVYLILESMEDVVTQSCMRSCWINLQLLQTEHVRMIPFANEQNVLTAYLIILKYGLSLPKWVKDNFGTRKWHTEN